MARSHRISLPVVLLSIWGLTSFKAITNYIYSVCLDKRSSVTCTLCKQNANWRPPKMDASTPLEATCRLPVPNYYSCLQTFISGDGPQNRLHTRLANSDGSSAQEWTWIYSWWKEPIRARAARLPSASPESRHLWRHFLKIVIIALPFLAATTCVMIAFVALPPHLPSHRTAPPSPSPIAHGGNQGE